MLLIYVTYPVTDFEHPGSIYMAHGDPKNLTIEMTSMLGVWVLSIKSGISKKQFLNWASKAFESYEILEDTL